MTQMTVRHMQDDPLEKALAWTEDEVEGYLAREVATLEA
jgi:hypothetical protein